jgi:YggT family protein
MMQTITQVVSFLFQAYQFAILIRVLLTWVNVNPYRPAVDHPVVEFLYRITDPILKPLQRIIPPIGGTIDISPIVAIFLLEILRRIVVDLLMRI